MTTNSTAGMTPAASKTSIEAAPSVLERDAAADTRAFYLQAVFRALLDAMARPGEIVELPAVPAQVTSEAQRMGLDANTLMLVDVLLDAATTFAVAAENDACERAVAQRTHCPATALDQAAYVVLPRACQDECAAEAVASLTAGSLVSPHLGATALVECGALLGLDKNGNRTGSVAGGRKLTDWTLAGPGIATTSNIACDRADVLGARCERGDEFPCGIDLVLIDGAGNVCCVPRSTKLTPAAQPVFTKGGASWDM